MTDKLDARQQNVAYFIVTGILLVALVGMQFAGVISDPTLTAIAWFAGLFLVTICVPKALIPILATQRH